MAYSLSQTDSLHGIAEPWIIANLIPGAVHFEEHEPGALIRESRIEISECLFPISQPGMGARIVERRHVPVGGRAIGELIQFKLRPCSLGLAVTLGAMRAREV